jgi:predicted nucleotidyltransferase component of viral defense system
VKDIIQNRLDNFYNVKTSEDELNALKEITQEVVLYSLYQVNFFDEACFLGGTCLRIVHSLDRFSEDLDFSTREKKKNFNLDKYLENAMKIMKPYGYDLSIDDKDLKNKTVQARFLKDESIKKVLTFKHKQDERQKIKVKIEIDTDPPKGAIYKNEFIDFPEDFQVLAYDPSSLMSGKIHALLCREYSKGRDWYDFSWYVKNNYSPNYTLLKNALKQLGPWKGKNIEVDEKFIKDELIKKINQTDWNDIKVDVRKFLNATKAQALNLWGIEFFEDKVRKLKT